MGVLRCQIRFKSEFTFYDQSSVALNLPVLVRGMAGIYTSVGERKFPEKRRNGMDQFALRRWERNRKKTPYK